MDTRLERIGIWKTIRKGNRNLWKDLENKESFSINWEGDCNMELDKSMESIMLSDLG